jgi:hypothetical protein
MMLAKARALNSASFPPYLRSESKASNMDREESTASSLKIETRQVVQSEETAPIPNPSSNSAVSDVNSSLDSCKTSQIEAIRIMQLYLKPAPRSNSIDSLFASGPATPAASLPSGAITKPPTNPPILENSMFVTAELLKQHLTSENADDQLLHQILFSTMDRSKSTTSSSNVKPSAELCRGAKPSATSQTNPELTVDEVIAQKKSYLDSLQQQMARSTCNEMDCNLFSSTAWKPLLQPNHQDIDYSTNIFASAFASAAGPVEATEPPSPTTMVTNSETIILPPATSAAETLLIAAELAEVATNSAASEIKYTRALRKSPQRNLIRGHDEYQDSTIQLTKPATSAPATIHETSSTQDVRLIEDSEITKHDVLLGRGGRTNHHEGNKKYLQYKLVLQAQYFRANKEGKTRISQQLVQMVHDQKGRFLKQAEPDMIKRAHGAFRRRKNFDDSDDDQVWYEVDLLTARKKASQTLREQSTPEFRAAKRAKYPK